MLTRHDAASLIATHLIAIIFGLLVGLMVFALATGNVTPRNTEVWCFDPEWKESTAPGDYAVSIANCQTPQEQPVTVKWID
jgi:hypothetical protein